MGQILLVRHAEKGNGSDTGKKFHLSPAGQAAALELGRNLPEEFVKNLKYVGGSEMSRSLHTALLIAMGAGVDPQILASDWRLGSENQLFNEFGVTIESYIEAMTKCNEIEIDALRMILTDDLYTDLSEQIQEACAEAMHLDGNAILGTHSPWLQLEIEAFYFPQKQFHNNVNFLDWILIETRTIDDDENFEVSIIASSMVI